MADPRALTDTPVWIINLDRATERRKTMEQRLAALGLPYERFSAVDGAASWERIAPTVDIPAFQRNTGRDVMKGEIGCFHSHLGVWQNLVASNAEQALILEDDVVFHDDFLQALEVALANRDQWDYLKLNKIRAQHPVEVLRDGGYTFNAYRGPATGTGAYLIKSDLAERLLNDVLPATRPIDIEIDRIHIHNFRMLGIEPFPSHVDDGNVSTITGTGFGNVKKYPWYRRLPAYVLRWRNLRDKSRFLRRQFASRS